MSYNISIEGREKKMKTITFKQYMNKQAKHAMRWAQKHNDSIETWIVRHASQYRKHMEYRVQIAA